VEINPQDNDLEHMQLHVIAMQKVGDPTGVFASHIELHKQQAQKKALVQAGMGGGQPGAPGGAGPGIAGTPRPGAVPAGPRAGPQQPPGAIPPGQMSDPGRMPAGHA
jgi:hypothetical protein